MQVQPYLFFDGRCDEAIEFYKRAVGAKVNMLMRFKDAPPMPSDPGGCQPDPANADMVMHANISIGDTEILVSDGNAKGQPKFDGFSLALTADNIAAAERLFAALGEGGKVCMPMTQTFFSPRFGMVNDKFGVSWMVLVAK